MKGWGNLSFGPLLKVVVIVTAWALLTHWLACGYFVVGWATCSYYEDIGTGNWITVYYRRTVGRSETADHGGITIADLCIQGVEPLEACELAGVTITTLHIRSLGWSLATMSSMGYGDAPVAISDFDYIYSFITQARTRAHSRILDVEVRARAQRSCP